MSREKMTAREYALAYESLKADMEILKSKISMRLVNLAKRFPDAPISMLGDTAIKAKTINTSSIHIFTIEYQIELIGKIEDYILEQHPVKQTKINF